MKRWEADDLSIAYLDEGPRDGPVALLLHGWPDDATTWKHVSSRLNSDGIRTIVPTLRGFGETVIKPGGARSGDVGILAMDAIALLDGLGVGHFHIAGHDWGSNIAEAIAVGWPERVNSIAQLSTPPRIGGVPTSGFLQARRQWYHWFMATKRGAAAVHADPIGFAEVMWRSWSPDGWFSEDCFAEVSQAFRNPAWADVTVHSYRVRWDEAEPESRSKWLVDRVRDTPQICQPGLYIQGELDGVNPPETSADLSGKFANGLEHVLLSGVGHFPTREAPDEVAAALLGHWRRL